MIVRELELSPFAGFRRLKVDFRQGLNVVLGRNEAGKSTLVSALKMVLFMATQYDKRAFDKEITPFIPLTGGDTLRVELVFSLGKDRYRLSKSWGKRRESNLTLPEGGLLSDSKAVQEMLSKLLGLKEGTWNHVLFACQAGLGATLDTLRQDLGPVHDLASILRRGFLETDGVSIDLLGKKIEERFQDYFSHWDRGLNGPENNRGIENPYRKEVGKVLEAFYEKERLRRALQHAVTYEREMDDLNREIQTILTETIVLKEFIDRNGAVVEDARRRVVLELEIGNLRQEEGRLRGISLKWPALEQELKSLGEHLGTLVKKAEYLKEELAQAEAYESNRRNIEKFSQAAKKKNELEAALLALGSLKPVGREDFQRLERMHHELSRLKTGLEAGKIGLTMTAQEEMNLKVRKDFEEEVSCSLSPSQPLALSAGGQIVVEHPGWTLKVKSGETDFEEMSAHFNRISGDYHGLLQRLSVADFEEGRRAFEACQKETGAAEALKRQLEEILEGETCEGLERLAGLTPPIPGRRSMADIAKENAEAVGSLRQAEGTLASGGKQIAEWERDYGSKEELLDLLVEKRGELKGREERLRLLKPLPEEILNAESFILVFETKQKTLKKIEQDLSEKRIARAELEGRGPEETAEEIETRREGSRGPLQEDRKRGRCDFGDPRSLSGSQTIDG